MQKVKETKKEEIAIPYTLRTFLNDVVDEKFGFKTGEPWKFSEESLAVVVPILRINPPEREYTTMYEVLKDLNIKDTGSISQVELQNKTGKAIFIRAGTIFKGETQPRASQHSGVYKSEKESIPVRCVQQTHGINMGTIMQYGDIAPMSVTMNLMARDQSDVWQSVRRYTGGSIRSSSNTGYQFQSTSGPARTLMPRTRASRTSNFINSGYIGSLMYGNAGGSDDLYGHLQKAKEGQSLLDEMMQKVPLFESQVGAVIFNPVGVIAVEMFDHPMSWSAIKKEIIEKLGSKISDKQSEHLFELKPDMIIPMLKKFISRLDKCDEKLIKQDNFSETRSVLGNDIVGEYTLIQGKVIHTLLLKENIAS